MPLTNKTATAELIWNPSHNTFTSTRTGENLKHFEIRGKSPRGNKMSMIIQPDRERKCIKQVEMFPILLGVKRIRWADGTFTDLEQIGTREEITRYLNESEAEKGVEHD